MKKNKSTIILILVFFVGLSVMLYPTLSDYVNQLHQSRAVATYAEDVDNLTDADYSAYFDAADAFNAQVAANENALYRPDQLTGYNDTLDITGTGIMGYITISKIGVELPIYHGTSDGVLQIAAGHLEGTSLPVGGESTHAVISAHRGLPSAKLFTNLDQLEVGDTFTITVLDRVLTYEVDKISIVLPTETDELKIAEGKDYVTLMTCTPYGINTHRLLVRGERTEYIPPEELAEQNAVHEVQSQTITKRIVDVWPWLVVSLLIMAGVEGSIFLLIVKRQRSRGDVREKRKKGKRRKL